VFLLSVLSVIPSLVPEFPTNRARRMGMNDEVAEC
jgi:hypothetical protein